MRCTQKRSFVELTFCALLFLGVAGLVRAEDLPQNPADQPGDQSLKELSLEQLGQVEITTATKAPEEVWRTPAAVYVLTQDDIRRSGATSIPEVLRLVPGVEVAQVDSDHWAIGVRGFQSGFSKGLLVLIDGRSVYTPLFEGVYWEVQDVVLEDVERIEVIRGPGGTIWGPNAVDGVINIITKSAKDTHGQLASVGGGTVNEGMGTFRYGGGNGKGFDYRVYGTAFADGPEHHLDGDNFDTWQMGQAGFRMDWSNEGSNRWTLQGDLYRGSDGERKQVATYVPPALNTIDDSADVSGGNILARWQHKLDNGGDMQLQVYYDRTYRNGVQLGESRNTFDVDFVNHLRLARHQDFIWGVGARISPSNLIENAPTAVFLPLHETDSVYSGFIQDEIPIVKDKLSFTVGTKLEHNNFSGFQVQPSARLLWMQSPHRTFWASITRAVRDPGRLDDDLQLTGFVQNNPLIYLRIEGDPSFKSESTVSTEAGYRTLLSPKFYVDVDAFHNVYENLSSYGNIFFTNETDQGVSFLLINVPYANGLHGSGNGVEIAPDWKPFSWWELKGSYSYVSLNISGSDSGTAAGDMGASPNHEVKIESHFDIGKRFELDPTYRYVSALAAGPIPAYQTADLRFGWHFVNHFELSLVGQNLFQPFHAEYGGDPGPLVYIRRSAYAKLTWVK